MKRYCHNCWNYNKGLLGHLPITNISPYCEKGKKKLNASKCKLYDRYILKDLGQWSAVAIFIILIIWICSLSK